MLSRKGLKGTRGIANGRSRLDSLESEFSESDLYRGRVAMNENGSTVFSRFLQPCPHTRLCVDSRLTHGQRLHLEIN